MRLLIKVQHMLAELYVQMHLPKDTEMYCHKGLETARSLDSAEVKLIVGNMYFIFHPEIYITFNLHKKTSELYFVMHTYFGSSNLLSQDSCFVVCVWHCWWMDGYMLCQGFSKRSALLDTFLSILVLKAQPCC